MKNINCELFGKTSKGEEVYAYTVTNGVGASFTALSFGGVITKIIVPDKNGELIDVVLGYDEVAPYESLECFFGCFVGRYANRINNAVFTLGGKTYELEKNNGNHNLHGGFSGMSGKNFLVSATEKGLEFRYKSPDGEGGFPGNMDVVLEYSLTEDNSLVLEYGATCDALSLANFTNHSYFNLNGHNSGDVLSHNLEVSADFFTENTDECVPTGEILSVEGTPLDFRTAKEIGKNIDEKHSQIMHFGGYDNNFVLKKSSDMCEVAKAVGDKSGITMTVQTTKPGMQLYTGNSIDNVSGKDGYIYEKHAGFCLETGLFPGGPDFKNFPDVTISPEKPYRHTTIYNFR